MKDAKRPKRALIKLSGEMIGGKAGFGFDPNVLSYLADEIASLVDGNTQLAIVTGGGNVIRGGQLALGEVDRVSGDHMGMLATIMNGIALRDTLEAHGVPTRVLSAVAVQGVVTQYDRRRAIQLMEAGSVVLLTAGTGNPFFSTDSAAVLRSIELQVDVMIKATKVDGVYDRDPIRYPDAKRFDTLQLGQAIDMRLSFMDEQALMLAREHALELQIVRLSEAGSMARAIAGEAIGTRVISKGVDA